MSKGLRTTFLVHVIVCLVFGLLLFFIPKSYESFMGWDPIDPTIARVLGAALLGLAVSSWLGYKAMSWAEVRIVVIQEIAFTFLGGVATLYEMLGPGDPVMGWISIAVMVIFCILWIYFYTKTNS